MITREQAENANEFHFGKCERVVGPRGGVREKVERWWRNGKTQTWKRSPGDFRIPVKYGLKRCGQIRNCNANGFHAAEDCPLNKQEG